MPKITKIPASISRYTSAPIDAPVKRKVAAYARVSTDSEEQLTSYAAQISYYTEYIKGREDWEFVGVYTDEGISGCSTKRREGFQRMISDAMAGKTDLIITKSVSRFARNTVDSLTTIRLLKENNVECYFEKENIWTFDGKGELLLTIMSSISQEEARSISENVTWGHRKRFSDGKVSVAYSRFLGYDKGSDGKMVVNPEQAEIVKLIYRLFLEGMTPHTIAIHLTEKGIKTPGGKDKWNATTIRRILTNEKYKGDALLQKEFTVDFLTKKTKKNCGEIPMYYIEDDHEAIIDPAVFDMVQQEMERRKTGASRYSGVSIFSSKIKCGECGGWYGAKVWHSTDQYRKVIYRCNNKYNDERCTTPHIMEEEVKTVFLKSLNKLLANRDELIENVKLICDKLTDTSELEAEKEKYAEEMSLVADMVQAAMLENARIALDQEEYRQKNDVLSARFEAAKKKHDELAMQIEEIETRGQNLRHFQETLESLNGQVTEFDSTLWGSLVDYITVYENGEKTVTFRENSNRRPDILLFINGLPLVLIELKSPSREDTDASEGYTQIRNYMHEIPSMFYYNQICVMSDQLTSKAGTITSDETRFMEWKTVDGSYENTQFAQFDTFFEGIFQKKRLLDILKNFILFSNDGTKQIKILAGYHQYFAVNKAIVSTQKATETDGKGGVFWHTQGSGKSLSMVFYAHLLQSALNSPTIVVLTDRNDLDDQLYLQFAMCSDFLRQKPIHAESREHLKSLLDGRVANGIIFTTMQKFEESFDCLSERRNIVVMADEAHRGQYGLTEKVDEKSGKIKIGAARVIRNSLPNATYIGFTGTPISMKDKSTREVFGDYIDIYDMTQAVEDGATRPVYYESRVIKLKLNEETMKLIDQEYDIMAQNADAGVIEQSKHQLGKMEAILGNEQTINSLVTDILDHYENNRANLLTGKAMIVAYSRPIALKIYHKILEIHPDWTEKVAVVMTSSNKDPEEWREIIGNKAHKEELAKKFKDNSSPLKIAIVVDMWLTGFDVPSLATMYVYKPMSGHNLMQAIARVNRVFEDKEGGLVVDYVGIASALKQAMNDYTARDKDRYGDTDVAKVAYPKFLEKLSVCRDFFFEYDYTKFMSGTDLERAKTITGAVNFIISPAKEEDKKEYLKESLLLHQALSLCSSMVEESLRLEAAFFESVRVLVLRFENKGTGKKISLTEMNARINELLKQSIKSDGVINLFSDIGEEFSLFDPQFLQEVANMKEKNLAVELLKKLISEQIIVYKRTNVVKSEKFSEIMQRTMNQYLNGMLTNEEVIEEMMKLAKQIKEAGEEGKALGLTADELAFYDALTKPQAIKDFYENEELIAITKELTETLRRNKTIDWQKKDSARARMRMMIKKLLKTHKYPPDDQPEAIDAVMTQCELWADNNVE